MGQAQISPYLFRVKAAFFTLANIFQIAQDQKLRYSASFFTAVYIYIKKKAMGLHSLPTAKDSRQELREQELSASDL